MTEREKAAMIAMIARIIQDEIGGEVCTQEWAKAAADRIVCAFANEPFPISLAEMRKPEEQAKNERSKAALGAADGQSPK